MVRAPERYALLWGAKSHAGVEFDRNDTWHECCKGYSEDLLIRSTSWH